MENKNLLHGKTLLDIITYLEYGHGFENLGKKIKIKCFTDNPSIKSCLTFLRKTDWARQKVKALYIETRMQKL